MLVPTGLSKKEREAYDKEHVRTLPKDINKGPRSGLRPAGGDKKPKAKK